MRSAPLEAWRDVGAFCDVKPIEWSGLVERNQDTLAAATKLG